MRKLILLIVVGLAVGALFGQLMQSMPGYWLVRVGDTSIQTSFWLGLVILLAVFLVLHFALRLLRRLRRPVSRLKVWNSRTRNRNAMKRTVRGLVALAEGRWKRAEKDLVKAADDSSTPLVNYLSAALAAHYQGRFDHADTLLKRAHHSTEGADSAVGMVQAQLMLDRQQFEEALATLTRLEKQLPNHPQVLKLLRQAYLSVNDWEGLRHLLPKLDKQQLITEEERQELEQRAYRELILQAVQRQPNADVNRVRNLWADMPDYLRSDVELVVLYTEALVKGGEEAIAERLLRHSLKEHWDTRLVLRYGLLNVDAGRQLAYAEKWLQERPNDPDLLLTLGRLSLRNAYWGKAQEYFEASQRQRPSGVVCAELARLYANLGEHQKSQLFYRQSVELLDRSLPALPQPSERTR
ncbi:MULTISPECIES: heme biosynthesis HemY N-terminal domain-containing protein [Chromohalobacter]|uniref:HemY-like protein n=1 Tax=Chromohalobacter israelensis (strain ATCC BAA-138 / DSM 3043 / CIP 106854 / NCIMB 13768 / 1H11) TaxID=290398 RepID=Q1QSV8_CHRI1|nr:MULTISPECIES: heme biosynthesis HemY N-terminal domain-containing protein [Chromohalobacter]ABE60450.1 HemY-like protein [Chromohalobacter salexigens DSM 3043]MBZ5874952.1 tetratricopeptide repeat protein [Chromohalobacter salexigens]MDO0945705.1 heme biosynthesis HemY N-terminal domain-containing protein [Chromohalobacter salexigens]NQY46370.1 tetratricopeptide repeat protein [Chromohalobacter sp.]NWO57645.1 heme biosynthesis protein HemY [Chromohalobacter salexigens]